MIQRLEKENRFGKGYLDTRHMKQISFLIFSLLIVLCTSRTSSAEEEKEELLVLVDAEVETKFLVDAADLLLETSVGKVRRLPARVLQIVDRPDIQAKRQRCIVGAFIPKKDLLAGDKVLKYAFLLTSSLDESATSEPYVVEKSILPEFRGNQSNISSQLSELTSEVEEQRSAVSDLYSQAQRMVVKMPDSPDIRDIQDRIEAARTGADADEKLSFLADKVSKARDLAKKPGNKDLDEIWLQLVGDHDQVVKSTALAFQEKQKRRNTFEHSLRARRQLINEMRRVDRLQLETELAELQRQKEELARYIEGH